MKFVFVCVGVDGFIFFEFEGVFDVGFYYFDGEVGCVFVMWDEFVWFWCGVGGLRFGVEWIVVGFYWVIYYGGDKVVFDVVVEEIEC